MAKDDFESDDTNLKPNITRAALKTQRRMRRRRKAQEAPVVARYGVWTGEGYLREGESLEKKLAEASLTVDGQVPSKRRKKKK